MPVSEEALAAARVVWEYHCLEQAAIPGDVIIALGTNAISFAKSEFVLLPIPSVENVRFTASSDNRSALIMCGAAAAP